MAWIQLQLELHISLVHGKCAGLFGGEVAIGIEYTHCIKKG